MFVSKVGVSQCKQWPVIGRSSADSYALYCRNRAGRCAFEHRRLGAKDFGVAADRLSPLAEAFAELPTRSAVLDGELCLCDDRGRPDFRAFSRRDASASARGVANGI